MKTIEIKIYSFNELSDEAKKKAINDYSKNIPYDHVYSEAYNTVKSFNEAFILKEGRHSWLIPNMDNVKDSILNLTGLRLRKYILNNFSYILFKPRFLKSLKNGTTRHRNIKNKTYKTGNKSAFYYSSVFVGSCCNLTGVCYDESILDPIYDFLSEDFKSSITFEELIESSFNSLEKDIKNEIESMQKDEYIIEEIENNDLEFTENGAIY